MSYWFWDKHKEFNSLPQLKTGSNIGYRVSQDLYNNRLQNTEHSEQGFVFKGDDRCWTPISDLFSESESGTPDFLSEESDSSTGSALRRSTNEATNILAREWERIERTLYDEEGEKSTRPEIIEECDQWKALHPQLRIIGKGIKLPPRKFGCQSVEYDEIIAIDVTDNDSTWDSDERLSQSSSDVTPCNSPRESTENLNQPKLNREKINANFTQSSEDFPNSFSSLLHITPARVYSPLYRKHTSVLRSEMASSKWMRDKSDDRNSAKSLSTNSRSSATLLSATRSRKSSNNRIPTARCTDLGRLEPICYQAFPQNSFTRFPMAQHSCRKVSLPPLLLEEEKRTAVSGSARKHKVKQRPTSKYYNLEKVTHKN